MGSILHVSKKFQQEEKISCITRLVEREETVGEALIQNQRGGVHAERGQKNVYRQKRGRKKAATRERGDGSSGAKWRRRTSGRGSTPRRLPLGRVKREEGVLLHFAERGGLQEGSVMREKIYDEAKGTRGVSEIVRFGALDLKWRRVYLEVVFSNISKDQCLSRKGVR